MIERDPGHSARYVQRFKTMAANGADLVGEARLIDALVPRGASILDAGCGPGRHAGYLHRAGHRVVGVDLDPALIAAAEADDPGPTYLACDLAALDLHDQGLDVAAVIDLRHAPADQALAGALAQRWNRCYSHRLGSSRTKSRTAECNAVTARQPKRPSV